MSDTYDNLLEERRKASEKAVQAFFALAAIKHEVESLEKDGLATEDNYRQLTFWTQNRTNCELEWKKAVLDVEQFEAALVNP